MNGIRDKRKQQYDERILLRDEIFVAAGIIFY